MEMLDSMFGGETSMATQLILIAIVVAGGLLLAYWLFKRITGTSKLVGSRKRQPRLAVTDATYVDDKRRLILVRRDNVEHLVLIGGPSDVVIETNVQRQRVAPATVQQATLSAETQPSLPTQSPPLPAPEIAREPKSQQTSTPQAIAAAAVGAVTASQLAGSSRPETHLVAPNLDAKEVADTASEVNAQSQPEGPDQEPGPGLRESTESASEQTQVSSVEVQPPEAVSVEPVRSLTNSQPQMPTPQEGDRDEPVLNAEPEKTPEMNVELERDTAAPQSEQPSEPVTSEFSPAVDSSKNENQAIAQPVVDDNPAIQEAEPETGIDHGATNNESAVEPELSDSGAAPEPAASLVQSSIYPEVTAPSVRHVETVESVSLDATTEIPMDGEDALPEPVLPEPVMPEKPAVTTDEIRVAAASVTEKIDEIIGDAPLPATEGTENRTSRALIEDDLAASIDGPPHLHSASIDTRQADYSNGVEAAPIAAGDEMSDLSNIGRIENSEDEMKRLLNELSGDKVN